MEGESTKKLVYNEGNEEQDPILPIKELTNKNQPNYQNFFQFTLSISNLSIITTNKIEFNFVPTDNINNIPDCYYKYVKLLYKKNPPYLQIMSSSDSKEKPIDFLDCYKRQDFNLKNVTIKKMIGIKSSQVQIRKFKATSGKKYYLKRSVLYEILEKEKNSGKVIKFIENKYKEYCQLKSLSASFTLSRPISFDIVFNKNLNFIATELVVEGKGKNLLKNLPRFSIETIYNISIQLTHLLQFAEAFGLNLNYISTANGLLIKSKTSYLIHILGINSNVKDRKRGFNYLKGLEKDKSLFWAPEVLKSSIPLTEFSKSNYWKAQIYSVGMFIFLLYNGPENQICNLIDLNDMKQTPQNYEKFISTLIKYQKLCQGELEKKLMEALICSLDYNPDKRLMPTNLASLLKPFKLNQEENKTVKSPNFRIVYKKKKRNLVNRKAKNELIRNLKPKLIQQKEVLALKQKTNNELFITLCTKFVPIYSEENKKKQTFNSKKDMLKSKEDKVDKLRKELNSYHNKLGDLISTNKEIKVGFIKEVEYRANSIKINLNRRLELINSSKSQLNRMLVSWEKNEDGIKIGKETKKKLRSNELELAKLIKSNNGFNVELKKILFECDYCQIMQKLSTKFHDMYMSYLTKKKLEYETTNWKEKFFEDYEINVSLHENFKYTGQKSRHYPEGFGILKHIDGKTIEILIKNGKIQEFEILKNGESKIVHYKNKELIYNSKIEFYSYKSHLENSFCKQLKIKEKLTEEVTLKFKTIYNSFKKLDELQYFNFEGLKTITDLKDLICIESEDNLLTNKKIKLNYDNGNQYEGEVKNDQKEGIGKYSWKNGDVYIGEWKNNLREGFGKEQYISGGSYEGEYKNGKKEGKGKYCWDDGDIYIGEWENNLMEGFDKKQWVDGDSYEGEYENGNREGKGKYFWKNGDVYIGEYRNNLREGFGKEQFINSDSFEEEYKNNKKEGKGKYCWKNGDVYIGDWRNNSKEGMGKLFYTDGISMKGKFSNGLKNGLFEVWHDGVPQKDKIFKNDVEQS